MSPEFTIHFPPNFQRTWPTCEWVFIVNFIARPNMIPYNISCNNHGKGREGAASNLYLPLYVQALASSRYNILSVEEIIVLFRQYLFIYLFEILIKSIISIGTVWIAVGVVSEMTLCISILICLCKVRALCEEPSFFFVKFNTLF